MRRLDSAAYRRERGEFLCDSPKLVEEALRHGAQVVSLAVSDGVAAATGRRWSRGLGSKSRLPLTIC